MAAIHDLIAQIGEPRLRERLAAEWARATRERKFGLVFEDHLPELLPLPNARPRKGDLVAPRGGSLKDLWRVRGAKGGRLQCVRPQAEAAAAPDAPPEAPAEFETGDVMVVREFGEPIFPALVPVDAVSGRGADALWHTLIEADNYHALQLLEYLYAGQVDCIYIDPPYNSGARDWKYNNDYVDGNDAWRHSKWLAFMKRRLQIARRLLRSDSSVLIVTIDEREHLRLGLLLEQVFSAERVQMVSSLINPAGVSRIGGFGRSDEYVFFVFVGAASPSRIPLNREWVSSKGRTHTGSIRWDLLRRSGSNADRSDRPNLFYPIYIDPAVPKIIRAGKPLLGGINEADQVTGLDCILPIRKDGSHGNWQWSDTTLMSRVEQGRVRVRRSRKGGFVLYMLADGEFAKVERGEFEMIGRDVDGSLQVADNDPSEVLAIPASQWRISSHDATQYGSRLLADVVPRAGFPFPKSIYAVRDVLRFFVSANPDAIVLDFFAGSGTTLNAVNLLNAADGGRRRCILVTNNEVSAAESDTLRERGLNPGDDEWEAQGICRSVTWPRSKFTILGRRDDGTPLPGEYLTGRTRVIEKPRRFVQIGFVDPAQLGTVAKRRNVVSLIDGLPQTLVQDGVDFVVSDKHAASVLFDPESAEAWLEALDGQDHIASFYIVTPVKKLFDQIKAAVDDLLGPLHKSEDETRPMRDGLAANLAYFKLDFLDPERVSLKRAFREILPLLWLKAGAVGPRPELRAADPEPALFEPECSNFVVLLQESRLARLLRALAKRSTPLSHVFIVTDSDESFKRMAAEVRAAPGAAGAQVVQLYRDYLVNFLINQRQHGDGDAATGTAP